MGCHVCSPALIVMYCRHCTGLNKGRCPFLAVTAAGGVPPPRA
jgi:hypothetical protein